MSSFNVGTRIYGYCNGYFGRDDYDDKFIVLEGPTWIVCGYVERDAVACVNFKSEEEKNELLADWSKKPTDEEWAL